MIKFIIPLAPITKKNHQQIVWPKGKSRPIVTPSPQYKQYEKAALWHIPKLGDPISDPVCVMCRFFMPTRRKCDLTNLLQAIDDIMVKAGLLADDNYTIIQSHDGSRVFYDKENPRTEVTIKRIEPKDGPADAAKRLVDNGYEDITILSNYSYDTALIGVTEDGRAVYDYDLMVEWLMETEGWDEIEAVEWVDYNTIRALPYMGESAPVIVHRLEGDE